MIDVELRKWEASHMALASKRPDRPERPQGPGRRVQPMGLPERLDTVALGLGAVGSLALVGELGYAIFGRRGAEVLVALAAATLGAGAYARFHRPATTDPLSAAALKTRRDRRLASRLGHAVADPADPGPTAARDATERPRRLRRHGRHSQLRPGPASRATRRGS